MASPPPPLSAQRVETGVSDSDSGQDGGNAAKRDLIALRGQLKALDARIESMRELGEGPGLVIDGRHCRGGQDEAAPCP